MKPVFFLYHFNDIDHIVPIIWKCLQKGASVWVVMLDPDIVIETDPRLNFIKQFDRASFCYLHDIITGGKMGWLFQHKGKGLRFWVATKIRRLLQLTGISIQRMATFFKQNDIDICIFEWGSPQGRNRYEAFYGAKRLDLPVIVFPHGLNIFLNIDTTPELRKSYEAGRAVHASHSQYTAYVYQSEFHRQQALKLGIDEAITHVLGSARYYPEWQRIHLGFHKPFVARNDIRDKLKVVFMLPHWHYNVDREKTLSLLQSLVDVDWLYFVIKDHTRFSGKLPADIKADIETHMNCEVVDDVPSVSLVQWADVVLNFGSSIGLEALLQDKYLVHPSYLHTNTTVYDDSPAVWKVDSEEMLLLVLQKISSGEYTLPTTREKARLYSQVVFGSETVHDVLQTYYDFIKGFVEKSSEGEGELELNRE